MPGFFAFNTRMKPYFGSLSDAKLLFFAFFVYLYQKFLYLCHHETDDDNDIGSYGKRKDQSCCCLGCSLSFAYGRDGSRDYQCRQPTGVSRNGYRNGQGSGRLYCRGQADSLSSHRYLRARNQVQPLSVSARLL